MELFKLQENENILNAYSIKPTLPYDVDGKLIKKDKKDIEVATEINSKTVIYSLRLKEEIDEEIGEEVFIEKENIVFSKVKFEEEEDLEVVEKIEQITKNIGLEKNEENMEAIKILNDEGIPITRENVESFLLSKKCLKEIVENIDYDSAIELLKRDIDIEEESLQKIANSMKVLAWEKKDKLSYKDARKIAKNIYGRSMGKDIYDSIIALHTRGMEITKENIEKIKNIIYKLHKLKDINDKTYIKILKKNLEPSIDTLYKVEFSYTKEDINLNLASQMYEGFTMNQDATIEDLSKLLLDEGINDTEANLLLAQEFINYGLDIKKENFEDISEMKNSLNELIELLDEGNISLLLKEGIDPEKENINELVAKLKELEKSPADNLLESERASEELKFLEEIRDKDLIYLLKNGGDFKLENLKKIHVTDHIFEDRMDKKVLEKTLKVSNILNTLSDLDSETISFAARRFSRITLENLYESKVKLPTIDQAIPKIEDGRINIIKQEYMKVKNNLTVNLIKESVEEGLNIESMPLSKLNKYINKRTNNHKDVEALVKSIKGLRGMEEKLVPVAMKNRLNMSIKELEKINSFTRNEKGLASLTEELIKEGKNIPEEKIKSAIDELRKNSKRLSTSLKDSGKKTKRLYKDLVKSFIDLGNSFNSHGERGYERYSQQIEDFLKYSNIISGNDLIFQFPVELGANFRDLQVIIPDFKNSLSKNYLKFHLNINTSNLGNVEFDLEILDDDIDIRFNTDNERAFMDKEKLLEKRLNKIGYNLKTFSKESSKKKEEKLLKFVDMKV